MRRIWVGRALPPASSRLRSERQHGFDHMLRLRTGDEDGSSNNQVHPPEFLMAGDVLGGHTAGAFGKSGVVTGLLFYGQLSFGMREEVGAVATERKHQEQFGIQPR